MKDNRKGWGGRPLTLDERRRQLNRNADAFNEEINRALSEIDVVIGVVNASLKKLKAGGVAETDSRFINATKNMRDLQQLREITSRIHTNKIGK